MRKYLLALIALVVLSGSAMAAPAFEFRRPSDNTIEGTLDDSGNHITYGTMTVQGQDVSGYSLRLSSGVDLRQGGCVEFKGGRQCAPAVTSAGDVLSSGNNTFTGTTNTFRSNLILSTATLTGSASTNTGLVFIACDATSGNLTLTLPTLASSVGRAFHFKKVDSSANTCILDGNASETIDGEANQTIGTRYKSLSIWAGADEWHIY